MLSRRALVLGPPLVLGLRGARISTRALAVFIVAYPAFDAAVGVGSGVMLSGLGPLSADGMAAIEPALRALFWGPVTGLMAIVAAGAWVIALVAAAWIESAGARWRGAPRPA